MSANPLSDEPHPDNVTHSAFRSWIIDLEDDRIFEHVVEDFYTQLNWETELTQETRDGGYDVRLENSGQSKLVEVKHSNKVGPDVVREISGTALAENVTAVSVIAISFSDGATTAKEKIQNNSHLEIELRDTHELHRTFRKIGMWDLMEEYPVEREPDECGVFDY